MTKTVEESLPPRLRARLREQIRVWREVAFAIGDDNHKTSETYGVCAEELEALLTDWDV